jgi:ketosteroid isomerase-like protein
LNPGAPQSAPAAGRQEGAAPRSILSGEADRATLLTRLFIEALNARDVQALSTLVSDDVEFRNLLGGRPLRGREALERLVRAAADARLRLVRRDGEDVRVAEGALRVAVPVIELVGGSEIDGTATFELQGGKITAFEVSSELLRR